MSRLSEDGRRLEWQLLLALGVYFSLHVLLRVSISTSLDYDEAEQAVLSQWLLPGYTEQPPLYTWLQILFFQLFGESVLAVSLLKNTLLFATYLFVLLTAREILPDRRAAVLATAALLLIPQIAWESQRDMTHTTLAVAAAAATMWQSLRLVRRPDNIGYAILGLLVGIGLLAKANYLLFLAVLLLSLATTPQGRRLFCQPAAALTLLLVLAVAGSYLLWMYQHGEIVFAASHKFTPPAQYGPATGIISLAKSTVLFLSPLWLALLLVFPGIFRLRASVTKIFPETLPGRYLMVLFAVLAAIVLLFEITYVKDRWLQPVLFAAPIYAFSRLGPGQITARRSKIFLSLAAVAAIGVYAAFSLRVIAAPLTGHFSRLNYPFPEMSADIRAAGFTGGLIVSNDRFLAGNLLWQFPDSTAVIPGYGFEDITEKAGHRQAIAVWKADHGPQIPPQFATFLETTYQLNISTLPILFFEHRYAHAKSESVSLAMVQFSPVTTKTGAND